MRDIMQLYENVLQIKPQQQNLLVSLQKVKCLIYSDKIYIVISPDTKEFINQFPNLYQSATSFNDFELKCLESVFLFINNGLNALFNQVYSQINEVFR